METDDNIAPAVASPGGGEQITADDNNPSPQPTHVEPTPAPEPPKDEPPLSEGKKSSSPDPKAETSDSVKDGGESRGGEVGKPDHSPVKSRPPSGSVKSEGQNEVKSTESRPGSRTSLRSRSSRGQRSGDEGAEADGSPAVRPSSRKSDFDYGYKHKGAVPSDAHYVTFVVSIAVAVPTGHRQLEESYDDSSSELSLSRPSTSPATFSMEDENMPDLSKIVKRKKKLVEAPQIQNYYHTEYSIVPDDEPFKTDIIKFGIATKIFADHKDPKTRNTWIDGNLTWMAWTQSHTIPISEKLLKKMFGHNMELRIWDTKDKLSMRAKIDRPRMVRIPASKREHVCIFLEKMTHPYVWNDVIPGFIDADISGVKALVMKQSKRFLKLQPKRLYLDRPLPSQADLTGDNVDVTAPKTDKVTKQSKLEATKKASVLPTINLPEVPARAVTAAAVVAAKTGQSQAEEVYHDYSRLTKLAGTASPTGSSNRGGSDRASRSRSLPPQNRNKKDAHSTSLSPPRKAGGLKVGTKSVAESESSYQQKSSSAGGGRNDASAKPRRNRKAEAAAQAAAEKTRKFGLCCVPINMAALFAGLKSSTNRLHKPVPGIEDVFFSVTLDGQLMSEEQTIALNPLVIKIDSAKNMPDTPLSFDDLQQRCEPVHCQYKFYKEPYHISVGRDHDDRVYWNDINVVLLGTLEPSELREYLNGPPMEIEVHDRARILEKEKLQPTLFGDDLEDEKISNVGAVTGKRTTHNPLQGRPKPWDPYGSAKVKLSDLLLGEQIINAKVPIHNCATPDLLNDLQNGKTVGVSGSVDGPADPPLPVGHYLDAGSTLKVRFELAYPLTTPTEIAQKEPLETTYQCPFARLVFLFDYKNVKFLNKLLALLQSINAKALDLDTMPQHVIESALSTYKLSVAQQKSRDLDIVTGFQLLDGKCHLFVLEGLRDGAIRDLWEALPKPESTDVEVLYHSDLAFSKRLYGPLDVDLCRIKLHEPLDVITAQPLLYVRDMVPKPCFEALVKLNELRNIKKLRNAIQNDLFPTAEMIVSMSREFGVPLTAADHLELSNDQEVVQESKTTFEEFSAVREQRYWPPLDNYNPEYLQYLLGKQLGQLGQLGQTNLDFIKENVKTCIKKSDENRLERGKNKPVKIRANVEAHNYSTQSLNATELAKEKVRQELAKNPTQRYTYCQDFAHSMTVVPVDTEALKQRNERESKERWRTLAGWSFPGVANLRHCNQHSMKPGVARVDELKLPWKENTLHSNTLEPTLERDNFTWSERLYDLDRWKRHAPYFGKEPVTIHEAGDRLKQEQREVIQSDASKWRSKVVVDDSRTYFHRCNTQTELASQGSKSSNQVASLKGLLKDEGRKLALRKPGLAVEEIPPLNVVLNPSVDTLARRKGLPIVPAVHGEFDEHVNGFMPGPYREYSWSLERNKIPRHDYQHQRLAELKGQDFNVYHKERSNVSKTKLVPLSDSERENNLFRLTEEQQASVRPAFIIPSTSYKSLGRDETLVESVVSDNLQKQQTSLEVN